MAESVKAVNAARFRFRLKGLASRPGIVHGRARQITAFWICAQRQELKRVTSRHPPAQAAVRKRVVGCAQHQGSPCIGLSNLQGLSIQLQQAVNLGDGAAQAAHAGHGGGMHRAWRALAQERKALGRAASYIAVPAPRMPSRHTHQLGAPQADVDHKLAALLLHVHLRVMQGQRQPCSQHTSG